METLYSFAGKSSSKGVVYGIVIYLLYVFPVHFSAENEMVSVEEWFPVFILAIFCNFLRKQIWTQEIEKHFLLSLRKQ